LGRQDGGGALADAARGLGDRLAVVAGYLFSRV